MPTVDLNEAVKFLRYLAQPRPAVYTLEFPTEEVPRPAPVQRSVNSATLAAVLEEHKNTYYSVAIPKIGIVGKASKDELAATQFLHVDLDPQDGLDPNEELSRLYTLVSDGRPGAVPPPSAVIESGRGIQCLWRLATPLALPEHQEAVENANRWLLAQLNGPPGTHNIDRIMRLPGSWNCLDAKKLAKGYKPRQAILIELNTFVYTLSDFGKWTPPKNTDASSTAKSPSGPASANDITDEVVPVDPETYEEKYKHVNHRVRWLIHHGTPSSNLDEYISIHGLIPEGREPNDRSAWCHDVINQLLRAKVPDGEILGILLSPICGVSGHILDQTDPEYAARRQIARSKVVVSKDEPRSTGLPEIPPPEKTASHNVPNEVEVEIEGHDERDLLEYRVDDKNKKPLKIPHNLRAVLQEGPGRLGCRFCYNKFKEAITLDDRILQDCDLIKIRFEIDTLLHWLPNKEMFSELVEDEARKNAFHPVMDYLATLTWDGVPRLDTWLTRYGGAEDSPYTRAVGALPLIAAVRRVREPGADFQEVLTLVSSKQGTFKSTAVKTLCPNPDWFTDDLPFNVEAQQVIERLHGHWIVEAAEIRGLSKAQDNHIKAFCSRQVDIARMAYGKLAKRAPRQCVFIATSNDEKMLRDPTGNRRWWPVIVIGFDIAALEADRDQLWAEAVVREKTIGPHIKLHPSLYEAAAEVQEQHTIEHPHVDVLGRALDGMWGKILVADAWDLLGGSTPKSQDGSVQLGQAMNKLGWSRDKQRMKGSKPHNCFTKNYENDGQVMLGKNGEWIMAVRQKDGRPVAAYQSDAGTQSDMREEVPF